MNTSVKVTADKAGNVINASENNKEWGYIRVEQSRATIDEQNFVRKTTLSALIYGKVEDLASFGWEAGTVLPGRISVVESTTPFNPKAPEKDLKVAGSTGIVCMLGDEPIYRKNVYKSDANACDETIEHTNGDVIKAAYENSRKSDAIQPNASFSM
jgi:hypothetical protein